MILVDTSVWVDFLRGGNSFLTEHLEKGKVVMHSMVLGELACGYLKNRKMLMELWSALPSINESTHDETMLCIENYQLMGSGIGYVDSSLLTSVMLNPEIKLWSNDKSLKRLADELSLSHQIALS